MEKVKKYNAKMNLLDGFAEDIINIDDLNKIQDMEGLRDQTQKFSLKVKELVEAMQKRIKEQNDKKIAALNVHKIIIYRSMRLSCIRENNRPRKAVSMLSQNLKPSTRTVAK